MVNDEQRRKVAEELRSESETWRDTFPSATIEEEAFGAAIMSDLMIFVGLDDESSVHAIYARLADLIDRPTCQMVECTIDREDLLKVADECESADVDGVTDWADRIRKAVGTAKLLRNEVRNDRND